MCKFKTTHRPPWLSLRAAGRELGCSHQTVRRMVARGSLSVLELPGRYPRIQAVELDALVKAHRHTHPANKAS